MKNMAVLAVDAGGTSCRAVLCDRSGQVLCYAQGGSCNYHSIGLEQAATTLEGVFNSLMNQEEIQVSCVVVGLAGLDTPQDRVILTEVLLQCLAAANITATQVIVDNDALLTLKAAVGQNNGVILIAGTGSIACGITEAGQNTRVGGWGYQVGDEGSGYFIGKAALKHVLRAYDGRDEPSGVPAAIMRKLSLSDAAELIQWVYSSQFSVQRVAALAPAVLRLAEAGDVQATKIIDHACRELVHLVWTAICKLNLKELPFTVVLCGGLLEDTAFRQRLLTLLTDICANFTVMILQDQPICTNLQYGLATLGIQDAVLLMGLREQINQAKIRM